MLPLPELFGSESPPLVKAFGSELMVDSCCLKKLTGLRTEDGLMCFSENVDLNGCDDNY